jgi:hypothetical protein
LKPQQPPQICGNGAKFGRSGRPFLRFLLKDERSGVKKNEKQETPLLTQRRGVFFV